MPPEKWLLRIRLSTLFFFQFFVWACWMVPISTYGPSTLGFTGKEMGYIFSTTAIAAIISPLFVGFVADRFFATEHILCALHIVGGVCLFLTGVQHSFTYFFLFLLVSTIAFMPTLALSNSLTFRSLDDPATFPRIAMFGSIGWIISGWIVGFLIGERSAGFLYLGGVVEIILAIYALTLPHTPPQAKEGAIGDVLGLGAIKLLKDPEFLLFTVCAFLIGIPAVYYFVSCNLYLTEMAAPAPTALMTLGQLCEIVAMATMPIFIASIGLQKTLALGMLIWVVRYLLFASWSFPLVILAILVHGFSYVFVYTGAYIFVDTKAPRELRASAQSFIAFMMLGVAWLIGSNLAGRTNDSYQPAMKTIMQAAQIKDAKGNPVEATPSWNQLAAAFDANKDNVIESREVQQSLNKAEGSKDKDTLAVWRQVLVAVTPYASVSTMGQVAAATRGTEIYVTRENYLALNYHNWRDIWLWPAVMALVVLVVFVMAPVKKQPNQVTATEGEKESPEPQAETEPEVSPEPPVAEAAQGETEADAPPM